MLMILTEIRIGKASPRFGLHSPWKLSKGGYKLEISCANFTKSSKEAVANPRWVQSTIAAIFVYAKKNFFLVDSIMCMGLLNNRN